MSDVFISYSRRDRAFVKRLYDALRSHNRESWIDWADIPLIADWWQEIEKGIEGTNTFVFVMSPDSVTSEVCRCELEYAVEHNKRLVPILYREGFDFSQIHPQLARLNWLIFREEDYFEQSFYQLLQVIDTDLEYVEKHTRLMVQAIEWEQHERNESFLLRGDALEAAESWLAENKSPSPSGLHLAFIQTSRIYANRAAEPFFNRLIQLFIDSSFPIPTSPIPTSRRSREQWISFILRVILKLLKRTVRLVRFVELVTRLDWNLWKNMIWLSKMDRERLEILIQKADFDLPAGYGTYEQDVFISYSRRDKRFAKKLHSMLQRKKCKAWVDWGNIPPSVYWWREIERGIESANCFVFIISPYSIASEACTNEFLHALRYNKLILPIEYRDVSPLVKQNKVNSRLAELQWINFKKARFEDAFQELFLAMNTDPGHVNSHRNYLVKAREWEEKQQRDLLLRGEILKQAEEWLQAACDKKPPPSQLHWDYISASRAYAEEEERISREMHEKLKG